MYNSAMFFLLEWIWNNGIIFQTHSGISEKRAWLVRPCHLYHIKNNTFFLCVGMALRSGTDADAASVREVFMKLGYKIKINNDLSREDIFKLLKKGQ